MTNINISVKSNLKDTLLYLLVGVVFIFLPVYSFPSGGPQPVDTAIMLAITYVILTLELQEIEQLSLVIATLFIFIFWCTGVNSILYLISGQLSYLTYIVQPLYSTLMFVAFTIFFFRILRTEKIIFSIYTSLALSIIIPLLIHGTIEYSFKTRQELSFNNPNQLANFSVIMVATILALNNLFFYKHKNIAEKTIYFLSNTMVFSLAHYYILLSASRGGMLCILPLDVIALWKVTKNKLGIIVILLAFTMIAFSFKNLSNLDFLYDTKIYYRFTKQDIAAQMNKRTERNFESFDYGLILGKGKSLRELNQSNLGKSIEVHNTFTDILYSYGLIGSFFFISFIGFFLKLSFHAKYNILLLLSLVPMYLTHNMTRFRMGWIFLALILSIGLIRRNIIQSSLIAT